MENERRSSNHRADTPGRAPGPSNSRACRLLVLLCAVAGCSSGPPDYGRESVTFAPRYAPRTIAVAPAINLSGVSAPDPLLQADLVYQQMQAVRGVTVIPVNRVIQVSAALGIRSIDSHEQAAAICEALGADALAVPTITTFDPYDPPKMAASLQLFVTKYRDREGKLDVRALSRQATDRPVQSLPKNADFIQAARLFDAASGSTRDRIRVYASGRNDPSGPLGEREFYLNMDRYAAFVWHELIAETLDRFVD
jgi:hypothetical protein